MRSLLRGLPIAALVAVSVFLSGCASTPSDPDRPEPRGDAQSNERPPSVDAEINPDLIRFVEPDEWGRVQANCLVEVGFPEVQAMADGSVFYPEVPVEQASAYSSGRDLCARQYPVDPRFRSPLSEVQLEALHGYYESTLIPCLETEGYPIEDLPSRQAFIENYFTTGWSPYSYVTVEDENAWNRLQKSCPQWPLDLFG